MSQTCCQWCQRNWESSLQCHYVPDLGCRVRGNHLGWLHLEGGLGRACSFRREAVNKDWLYGVAGGVHCVLLVCKELWLTFAEVVFLMPWWLVGDGVLLCDGVASTSGSQKVTVFVVFLMSLELGEVGTFKLSTWEVAAMLGTLNATIPSLSEVT